METERTLVECFSEPFLCCLPFASKSHCLSDNTGTAASRSADARKANIWLRRCRVQSTSGRMQTRKGLSGADPECTSSEQRQHLHGPQTPRRDSGNVHAPRRFLQRAAPQGNLGNAPSAVPLARTKCESCGRHVGVDRQVRSREIHLAAGMAYISTNFNKFQHVMLIFVDFTNFNKFQQISTLNVEIC